MNYELKTHNFKGFSLIELLVVISLFGLSASLITASYLTFEKNQRVKSAAGQLKNDLRLVQNNALSGNKGAGGVCASTNSLAGWYMAIKKDGTSYTIAGDCLNSTIPLNQIESRFLEKPINLPKDTKIRYIFYPPVTVPPNNDVREQTAILYRPLTHDVSFHNAFVISNIDSTLDFFNNSTGVLQNFLNPQPQSTVTIELSNTAGNKCYRVKIEQSGEVNDDNTSVCSSP